MLACSRKARQRRSRRPKAPAKAAGRKADPAKPVTGAGCRARAAGRTRRRRQARAVGAQRWSKKTSSMPATIAGTGRDGRITKGDVLDAHGAGKDTPAPAQAARKPAPAASRRRRPARAPSSACR